MEETIERIRQMEQRFDILLEARNTSWELVHTDPFYQELLRILTEYYTGGQWLADYQLDEAGLLPDDLKRGILSQDGFYDFLLNQGDAP